MLFPHTAIVYIFTGLTDRQAKLVA